MPGWYRIIEIMDTFFTGTISLETSDTRIVFLGMLSLADRNGEVHAPALGIARWVNLPIETVEASLVRLMSPDTGSTSQAEDGRRILPIGPNEWKLVNYEKYRDIIRREKKRAIDAQRAYEKYHSDKPAAKATPKAEPAAAKPATERGPGVSRGTQAEGGASLSDVLKDKFNPSAPAVHREPPPGSSPVPKREPYVHPPEAKEHAAAVEVKCQACLASFHTLVDAENKFRDGESISESDIEALKDKARAAWKDYKAALDHIDDLGYPAITRLPSPAKDKPNYGMF